MTDQGGYGGWSPPRRSDDSGNPVEPSSSDQDGPTAPDGPPGSAPPPAESQPPAQPGQPPEPPPYGAPSYGAPSYGAPNYGGAAPEPPATPPSYGQPSSGQPASGQPSYGQPSSLPSDPQPTQAYGSYPGHTPPPSYGQPGQGAQPGQYESPPPYGAPTGQYAQPAQPGQYGQPAQPGQYGQPGHYGPGYGAPGAPPAAGPKKRSGGKIALIIGLVVVLVAGLSVGAWALFLRGGPAVTWQGNDIANPEGPLTQAQNEVATLVSDQKGVKAQDTRCYYSVPKNPPKDSSKTDVADTVYCGPALFVDGDTSKPYVPYGISAGSTSGDKVTLQLGAKGSEDGVTSVPGDRKLVRPDGKTPPSGAGGLKVPEPPPAEKNVFVAVTGLDVPDAPAGARMGSLDGGVLIEKLGEVKRYGKGADARSAPDGQKLIAFQLTDADGDATDASGASPLALTVSVDGGTGLAIPNLSGMNVIAVPTAAKTVDLVTKVNSLTQTLSLLDGKPGAGNIAVLARANRLGSFTVPAGFAFTESGGGSSASRPCTLTGSVAGLFYWADDDGTVSATSPGNAILETNLKYTYSTDPPAPFTGSSAGDSDIFEAPFLTLTLPDGTVIPAKALANRTVFEVPAGFTDGTITIAGAFTNTNAITFTVDAPGVSFPVSVPTS